MDEALLILIFRRLTFLEHYKVHTIITKTSDATVIANLNSPAQSHSIT
jgi:hypothetical protein